MGKRMVKGGWDQECSFGRCQKPNPARQGSSQSGTDMVWDGCMAFFVVYLSIKQIIQRQIMHVLLIRLFLPPTHPKKKTFPHLYLSLLITVDIRISLHVTIENS